MSHFLMMIKSYIICLLEIEKGKAYAFFGSSGCGKSTLLQLLLGYYHDYTGECVY